jgi:mannose-1-phosphate guanylyltransferase
MQAVVLAGGQGTRIRPLTHQVPKPVIPLCGRPFLLFMLDWLERYGVSEVVLCCGFGAQRVEETLGRRYRGLELSYLYEPTPLGTAGPVRLAADRGLLADRFLTLNGDILCDIDLSKLQAWHETHSAGGTLTLVEVADAASYGSIELNSDSSVSSFIEKGTDTGAEATSINAGIYMLEKQVVETIEPGRAVSFESEVFPSLIGRGLYGYQTTGYWIDIGTPERYLEATYDLLEGRVTSRLPARDGTGSLIYAPRPTDGAEIGPLSVLGPGCMVGPRSRVARSVLYQGVTLGSGCVVSDSVLADGVSVGDGAYIGPDAVVGHGASIGAGCHVGPGTRIDPNAKV